MQFFNTLGSLINQRWKKANYNEQSFPEIASRALSELPPHTHVSLWDVARWALQVDELPFQPDLAARFGDPPLTVFTGRGFRIDVLFWTQGTPSIHQHAFSGAFHVLQGSSLHSLWEFEPTERLEVRLLLGRVAFLRSEMLKQGDSRPIYAGSRMFHSTYHLDRPTLSVVVRTVSEADERPQYTLLPPTIAFAELDIVPSVQRQSQILKMLATAGKWGEYSEVARHALGTKDAYSVFQLLLSTFDQVEDEEERAELLMTASCIHPNLVEALRPALLRQESGHRMVQMYRKCESRELRLFLALLRNIPDGTAILDLVRRLYPTRDPITTVVSWVRQLSESGLLEFEFQESWLVMLLCLLMGLSDQEIRAAFNDHCISEQISDADLETLAWSLRNSWLLQPLFAYHASAAPRMELPDYGPAPRRQMESTEGSWQ